MNDDQDPRGECGAAAAEFAFLLPILVLLLLGTVQFGLAMYRISVVESAAREGARIAAVGAADGDITARVVAAAPGFDSGELVVTTTGCAGVGDDVTVTVVASGERLRISIPFWGAQDPNYSAVATFRCERL